MLYKLREQDEQSAVDKIIVIARDEHILAPARLDSPMNVPFRPDVLLIAMIAQILIYPLPLLDELPRVVRRSVVRDEHFHQGIIANLMECFRKRLAKARTAVAREEANRQ